MKKSLNTSFVIVPILILYSFVQCKKEYTPLTIRLYDKQLSTIQSSIEGFWKLHYGKGGISSNSIQYYDSVFCKFTNDNKIVQTYKGKIIVDTTIKWVKELGTYTNGDSTFTMNFSDKRGSPSIFVVDGIFNDTLVLHENGSDATFYHFTKSN